MHEIKTIITRVGENTKLCSLVTSTSDTPYLDAKIEWFVSLLKV